MAKGFHLHVAKSFHGILYTLSNSLGHAMKKKKTKLENFALVTFCDQKMRLHQCVMQIKHI